MRARRILINILLFLVKLLLAVLIAVAIYRLGAAAYRFGHSIYDNTSMSDPPGRDVAIVIPQGSTVAQVSELLAAKGLIADARVFRIQERLSRYHGQMQAGNYVLNTSQNAGEMIAIISGHAEDVKKKEEEE